MNKRKAIPFNVAAYLETDNELEAWAGAVLSADSIGVVFGTARH